MLGLMYTQDFDTKIGFYCLFSDQSTNSSQDTQPTFNSDGSDKLLALLEKFIEEDRIKTQSIATLSKAVLDLASEVKKLKEDR
jgi:hypothetical protein